LTSDEDKPPATAPVAAAPTVTPILLKNSRRAMFGISGRPLNFAMARFPFGELRHCSNHRRHRLFRKAPDRVFSLVPVRFVRL
jgi:hypothetical protein